MKKKFKENNRSDSRLMDFPDLKYVTNVFTFVFDFKSLSIPKQWRK